MDLKHAAESARLIMGSRKRRLVAAAAITAAVTAATGCNVLFDGTTFIAGAGASPGFKPPGLYYTSVPQGGYCYWERRRNNSGQLGGIIANGAITYGRQIVEIGPSDAAFYSQGCGLWATPPATSLNPNVATAKAGDYRIGKDLVAGTYASPGGSGCYWARLSGWSGEISDIIANGGFGPNQVVRISPSDVGFSTAGCGGWVRVGP